MIHVINFTVLGGSFPRTLSGRNFLMSDAMLRVDLLVSASNYLHLHRPHIKSQ